ncbi:MAG: UDP-N-acetylmuramate dehydrogenase [Candidatus Limimorpha sp.]
MKEYFSLLGKNTFGFNIIARYFVEVNSIDDIGEIIDNKIFKSYKDKNRVLILSGGSNILFKEEFFDGFVIHINIKGIEIIDNGESGEVTIRCQAGEVWKNFVDFTISESLYGLENLSGIPGYVGAAPVQNIGAYGSEVKDTIFQVHTIDLSSGEKKTFSNEECDFSYRNSIFKKNKSKDYLPLILAVDFKLKKSRELKLDYGNIRKSLESNGITNPSNKDISEIIKKTRDEKLPDTDVIGSAGSFFQNVIIDTKKYEELKSRYPEMPSYAEKNDMWKIPTGWLIEKAGWKGYREGHVGVWDKQALVLVHYGGGKPEEITELSEKIQSSILELFGINISTEVNII